MNILQICNKAPYPPRDGHTIAMYNLAKCLSDEKHKVKILSLNTNKHYVDFNTLPYDFIQSFDPIYCNINTSTNFFSAFINLFTNEPYNVIRFYSKEFEKIIIDTVTKQHFDIIHLETLFTTPYIDAIRRNSNSKIIFRPHNVEHIIWLGRAQNEKNPIIRQYLYVIAKRLKIYEKNVINFTDGIATISESDKNTFIEMGFKKPIITIPVGLDILSNNEAIKSNKNLFFIGSFDWAPNLDGLVWFLENVWHIVLKELPNTKLLLAGRNIQKYSDKLKYKNVTIIGEVEDSKVFMQKNGIMIAPLRYGSGIKVKIIEAMAYGKAIVTTTKGAEGLSVKNYKEIIIADDDKEFAYSVIRLLKEEELYQRISSNAYYFAKENFNNKIITAKLVRFYEKILENVDEEKA